MESQNEYFFKKEAKEKELQTKEAKKNVKKLLFWPVVLVVLGFGVWKVVVPIINAPDILEVTGDFFPAQNQEHISPGQSHPDYNSNPPTGGWHYPGPAQTGIYDKEFPDEQLIHNMEHGHILIAYRPDLNVDTVEKLADIAKSYSSKIIMVPRPKNDQPIAIVAWEYLLKLESFDENKILGFIKAHRGKGPESIPDFGFKDFRQK